MTMKTDDADQPRVITPSELRALIARGRQLRAEAFGDTVRAIFRAPGKVAKHAADTAQPTVKARAARRASA